VATITAGSTSATSARNAGSIGRSSGAPTCRSETWIRRVGTTGARYTLIRMDEPTELFDDLYLGLRAGGAIRKRRRGESLTSEEEAVLSRWQRLSQWRKTIAIGAFAVGTFGLGFTLGGIVFSRRRKQEAA
jgi:hypothetical protein